MNQTSVWSYQRIVRSAAYIVLGAVPVTYILCFGFFGFILSAMIFPVYSLILTPWLIAGAYGVTVLWALAVTPQPAHESLNRKVTCRLLVGCITYAPISYWILISDLDRIVSTALNETEFFISHNEQFRPSFKDAVCGFGP